MVGIFTRTGTNSSVSGWRSTNPRLVDRFDMNGNGCAGSRPSGVSAGETLRSKYSPASTRCAGVSVAQSASTMPCAASCGRSPPKHRACSSSIAVTATRICASSSRVEPRRATGSPSSSTSALPRSSPTRLMKNSSRLDPTIARNFSRSRSGVRSSSASASTRRLKSSQARSRSSQACSSRPLSPGCFPGAVCARAALAARLRAAVFAPRVPARDLALASMFSSHRALQHPLSAPFRGRHACGRVV